ncbi:MAG: hypothetical protein ABSF52_08805 [Syntrophobacteraceae bacterium]|jgi:hypothetical protein
MRFGFVDLARWFLLGAFVALVVDYYLYRVGLPMAPFIYQAF